jgi:bacteriocin-like protein
MPIHEQDPAELSRINPPEGCEEPLSDDDLKAITGGVSCPAGIGDTRVNDPG